MQLIRIPGMPMLGTNTFLLVTAQHNAVAIDPSGKPEHYRKALAENGAVLQAIFLTHGHFDHVAAVRALAAGTGAQVYLDAADRRGDTLFPLSASDLPFAAYPASGELALDELTFRFYHTPGHTAGSWCIYVDGKLFTGDTLFAGSCGRVDLDGGDPAAMHKSLALLKALPLPDATPVFPGHGSETTLGEERKSNPYLQGLLP